MIKAPIFKDTEYIFSNIADVRFRIVVSGSVIYEGRVKAKPNESSAVVNINKICMNYLNNTLENQSFSASTFTVNHSDAYKEFVLMRYNDVNDSWVTCETYGFLFNFSYEDISLNRNIQLSDSINTHKNTNMLIPTTIYSSGGTVTTSFTTYSGDSTYCGRYSLIYRNINGGWDSFLFEGKCRKEDEYDISKMNKNYNNTTHQMGTLRYYNEIKGKWVLNTGYLSDVECENFTRNLASSNECYLQDLVKGTIIPVVITDVTMKYKEYLNDGNDPVYYTLNVESSQIKVNM